MTAARRNRVAGVTGCYPLDDHQRERGRARSAHKRHKQQQRQRGDGGVTMRFTSCGVARVAVNDREARVVPILSGLLQLRVRQPPDHQLVLRALLVREDQALLGRPVLIVQLGLRGQHLQARLADQQRDAQVRGQHADVLPRHDDDVRGLREAHGGGLAEAAAGQRQHVVVDLLEAVLLHHARRLAWPLVAVELGQQRVVEPPVELDLVLVAHVAEVVEQPQKALAPLVAHAAVALLRHLRVPVVLPARHEQRVLALGRLPFHPDAVVGRKHARELAGHLKIYHQRVLLRYNQRGRRLREHVHGHERAGVLE